MKKECRQRNEQLKVRLSPQEKAQMQALAADCSCSVPALVRSVVLGYQVHSTFDRQVRRELAALHGDMGRLGGLLKLWLTQDEKWPGTGVTRQEVRDLVAKIERNQDALYAKMRAM